LEDAEQLLANARAGVEAEAEASVLTAALSLARGDAPGAGRLLEERLRHLEDHRWHLAGALDLLVDAYITAGRIEAATGAVERLEATADAARSRHLDALAAGARGRLLLANGELRGVAQLETALQVWSSLGLPLESARTRFALARALVTDEPDTAIDHARRALTAFEDLGAAIDADRAASFLRALGIVPRTGLKRAGVLTMRERDVLRLLGAGLSNPEIAERLHVSRKTASHHVSNILSKLGLRNRAEAAAHATVVLQESTGATPPSS
jgi:ATP/maltotriose-dependent transcriptional regulator MalT